MFSSIAYAMGGAGQPGADAGPAAMISSFMPIVLIIVVFYFLMIRPQQKKAKEHREMLNNLKKGDPVVTNGGMHGRIVDFVDDNVVVDLGDFKVTMLRGSLNLLPHNQRPPVPLKKSKKKDQQQQAVEAEEDDEE
ncbi:preprotein translocase subunit YajC [Desulfovibrio sp. OttesenSCG-928-C14]|nr:preprotein translocase subunit YajC [Desulfovibrio sp. OttesenSCG-928-C14]